jgi:hypothetical protein
MDFRVLGRRPNVSEVEYLPEPPATVEVGPNRAAPSADQTWLPGSWVWQQNRYAWRPGFWAAVQPDWVWTPAHYVYTPRGYVFVDGYWDYSVARRGVLFAPVYFTARTYTRPGFSYSPAMVINLGAFVDNLFFRPRYQHYYFGDYYAANYHNAGYFPSYSVNSSRYGYDPILRARALAASAGRRVGATRCRDLSEPSGPRRSPTVADLGGPERKRQRLGIRRTQSRGPIARSSVAEPDRCVAIPVHRPSGTTKAESTRARGPTLPRPAATMGNQSGGGSGHRPRSPRRAGPHETSLVSDCGQVG